MTLSELLHSVSFDDLIPTLKEVYGVETDIYAYREAFDELNLLLLFVARTRCGLYNEVCVASKCLTMNMMNMLSGADIHTGLYILSIVCQYVSCHVKSRCAPRPTVDKLVIVRFFGCVRDHCPTKQEDVPISL